MPSLFNNVTHPIIFDVKMTTKINNLEKNSFQYQCLFAKTMLSLSPATTHQTQQFCVRLSKEKELVNTTKSSETNSIHMYSHPCTVYPSIHPFIYLPNLRQVCLCIPG